MKKNLYILSFSITLIFTICLIDYLLYVRSCELSPINLSAPLFNTQTETHEIDLAPIITQNYQYLSEGKQCFALVSQDNKYVIKFFKNRHLNKKNWGKNGAILRHFRKRPTYKSEIWKNDLIETARRYETAQKRLFEETGVLYTHFDKTFLAPSFLQATSGNRKFLINLSNTSFIIQYKVELTKERISNFLKNGNVSSAIDSLMLIRNLLISRTKKGISDARQCYGVNFGFSDNAAIQLDVGKIFEDNNLINTPEQEIKLLSENLKSWVLKNYPSLYQDFIRKIETAEKII